MKKNWRRNWKKNNNGKTFDSDKYETIYNFNGKRFVKCIWETSPFVGPEAYNRSSYALVNSHYRNLANWVYHNTDNPLSTIKSSSFIEKAKFRP